MTKFLKISRKFYFGTSLRSFPLHLVKNKGFASSESPESPDKKEVIRSPQKRKFQARPFKYT